MKKNSPLIFILTFFLLLLGGCSGVDQGSGFGWLIGKKANTNTKPAEEQKKLEAEERAVGPKLGDQASKESVDKFCQQLEHKFKKYGWGESNCRSYNWLTKYKSVNDTPIVWMQYGKVAKGGLEDTDVTVILCGVHGDEITPVKFCFDVLDHLEELVTGKGHDGDRHGINDFDGKLVVVAPLVNPDSFFKKHPTRTNANGIDINRNMPTEDFKKDAIRLWKTRYRKDRRRYPGKKANSEPEVAFQVDLVKTLSPDKIISVHAPLTMLDYDGPADRHTGGLVGSRANQLLIQMSEKAQGYRIKNYPFFPGSLGNYAGNERNIPTYTLELPSSDNRKHKEYWKLFKGSIHSAIMHDMVKDMDVAFKNKKSDKTF